ncbi:MAG TPA: phosphopantetheine-binding protein, partial [Thermoanaerobaculia bacterium]|nr:phosphopantetheine-binding protein [Thermoanaerobaculia bacterium]
SSYTGGPIPAAEMREWVDATVERLLALPHHRVLEVGCGTGLLLFRVAPSAERYRATDFSGLALARVRAGLDVRPLPQVELAQAPADDWSGVRPGDFDLVVLNSIVQYFPGVDYLIRVLAGAVAAVAPGGAVFVGDVRSLPLLEAFHTSVERHRTPGSLPAGELERRVRRRVEDEEELVIDPQLFHALARWLPGVRRVQVLPKSGRHANELTRFRYDVILGVGDAEDGAAAGPPLLEEPRWSAWANDPLRATRARRLPPELRRFLEGELPEPMVPAAFVVLDALPLGASGKVDRAALPAPERPVEAEEWVPPATPLEEELARAVAELLGVERVGLRDNFFALGGHSLLATQLVSRLTQEHGMPVTLQMVFDAADLGDLADRIVERELAAAGDGVLDEVLRELKGEEER